MKFIINNAIKCFLSADQSCACHQCADVQMCRCRCPLLWQTLMGIVSFPVANMHRQQGETLERQACQTHDFIGTPFQSCAIHAIGCYRWSRKTSGSSIDMQPQYCTNHLFPGLPWNDPGLKMHNEWGPWAAMAMVLTHRDQSIITSVQDSTSETASNVQSSGTQAALISRGVQPGHYNPIALGCTGREGGQKREERHRLMYI